MRATLRSMPARTRLDAGGASAEKRPPSAPPALVDLASAAVLATAIVVACAIAFFAVVTRLAGHSETLEAVWWLTAIAAVPALSLFGAGLLLHSARAPAAKRRLPVTAAMAVVVLSVSLAAVRASGGLPLGLLAVLAVPLALGIARQSRLRALAASVPSYRAGALGAAAVGFACLLALAVFLPRGAHDPLVLVTAVVLLIVMRGLWGLLARLTPGPRLRIALAVVVPLALALLAWDISFQALASHQDFYLGPVNDIHHGRAMLVDDYSQYGVGVIYFLAGILAPLPFGYGSLVLVLGLLTSVMFSTIYVVLRVATRSAAFAGLGTFAALTASVIATEGRTTQVPSTGFLRFGLPWLIVCALVVAHRRERPSRPLLLTAAALVGIACIWSFEAAFYSVATFAATTLAVAWSGPRGTRIRSACAQLGAAAISAAVAVAGLIAATEIGRGTAPRPGGYIDFLRLYSVKNFGTLPIHAWSLGYVMCALYAVSLCGIGMIMRHARGTALAEPSTIVPLVAVTVFGATAFTYFVGRSHANNLTHVAPPFVAMLVLWAALAWRAWSHSRHPLAAAALGLCAIAGCVLVADQLVSLIVKADASALVALVNSATGREWTLSHQLRALTSEPVIDPKAHRIELLVRRHVPRGAPLLVITEPTNATEALIRLNRSDVLPIAAAEQDMLVARRRALLTREALTVPCATYVVTQRAALSLGHGLRLWDGILAALHERHAFHEVASVPGYRLFRLSCTA